MGVQDLAQHGIRSRETGSDALKESWEMADEANKARTDNETWEWIPVQAIEIRDADLPRQGEDAKTIEQYMVDIDQLPPIKVQADSLALIGGLNRVRAHERSSRRIVKADIVTVPDEDLWEQAFTDNRVHGLQMTQAERRAAGQRYMNAHPDFTDKEIALWAGVAESTVNSWRAPLRTPTSKQEQKAAEAASAPTAPPPTAPTTPTPPTTDEAPAPATNGSGTKSGVPAPAPAHSPASMAQAHTIGEMLDALLARSPSDIASETPDYGVATARAEAKRAALWFSQLAEALADREAEIGSRAQAPTLKERLIAAQSATE